MKDAHEPGTRHGTPRRRARAEVRGLAASAAAGRARPARRLSLHYATQLAARRAATPYAAAALCGRTPRGRHGVGCGEHDAQEALARVRPVVPDGLLGLGLDAQHRALVLAEQVVLRSRGAESGAGWAGAAVCASARRVKAAAIPLAGMRIQLPPAGCTAVMLLRRAQGARRMAHIECLAQGSEVVLAPVRLALDVEVRLEAVHKDAHAVARPVGAEHADDGRLRGDPRGPSALWEAWRLAAARLHEWLGRGAPLHGPSRRRSAVAIPATSLQARGLSVAARARSSSRPRTAGRLHAGAKAGASQQRAVGWPPARRCTGSNSLLQERLAEGHSRRLSVAGSGKTGSGRGQLRPTAVISASSTSSMMPASSSMKSKSSTGCEGCGPPPPVACPRGRRVAERAAPTLSRVTPEKVPCLVRLPLLTELHMAMGRPLDQA
jgi:hypothetical protein